LFQVPFQKVSSFVRGQIKEGVFVGPDIRKTMFDEEVFFALTEVETEAWIAFKSVLTKFLGEQQGP
jgi:hypothetical protein